MLRESLEHLIRAAAVIADDDELIIVGSQAILGTYPNAPAELLVSDEAESYPKNHPERSDLIDGSIGELSTFHDTFGYYAQGVAPNTRCFQQVGNSAWLQSTTRGRAAPRGGASTPTTWR